MNGAQSYWLYSSKVWAAKVVWILRYCQLLGGVAPWSWCFFWSCVDACTNPPKKLFAHNITNDIAPTMAATKAPLQGPPYQATAMILHPVRVNRPYFLTTQSIFFPLAGSLLTALLCCYTNTNDIAATVAAADAPVEHLPMELQPQYCAHREVFIPNSYDNHRNVFPMAGSLSAFILCNTQHTLVIGVIGGQRHFITRQSPTIHGATATILSP